MVDVGGCHSPFWQCECTMHLVCLTSFQFAKGGSNIHHHPPSHENIYQYLPAFMCFACICGGEHGNEAIYIANVLCKTDIHVYTYTHVTSCSLQVSCNPLHSFLFTCVKYVPCSNMLTIHTFLITLCLW